jgi:hypothetical protein
MPTATATLATSHAALLAERIGAAAENSKHPIHAAALKARQAINDCEAAEAERQRAEDALAQLTQAGKALGSEIQRIGAERGEAYRRQSERFIQAACTGELSVCLPDDLADVDSHFQALSEANRKLVLDDYPQAEARYRLAVIDVSRHTERMYSLLAEFSEELTAQEASVLLAVEGVEAKISIEGGFTGDCRRQAKAAAETTLHSESEYFTWLAAARARGLAV